MEGALTVLVGYFSGKAIKEGYKPTKGDKMVAISLFVFFGIAIVLVVIFLFWSNNGYKF